MANTTGKKWGGRKKGTPNKITTSIKEGFKLAFDAIGGHEELAKWGAENRTEFYKLASKLIPTEIANPEGETFKTETSINQDDRAIIERYLAGQKK